MNSITLSARRPLWPLALLAALLLGACGPSPAAAPQPATQPAAAAPSAAPTVAPATQPSAAPPATQPAATQPAAQPTSPPAGAATAQPGALLPAPLYFLNQDNQIWRIERDGATARQLTYERAPISDFDVAQSDGGLVYLTGEYGQATIVLLDAGGRTELISGPAGSPRFSPAGAQIAFELYQPVDGLQIGRDKGSDTGVWTTTRAGGRPSLLQASEPITDTNNPPSDARQYFPIAYSPDGTRLLLGGYFPVGEGGFIAVKQLSGGKTVEISDGCCQASWSADGAAVLISGGTQIQDAYLGLWRADPASGQATALIDGAKTNGSPLVTAARQLRDGTIYAFAAIASDPAFDRVNEVQAQQLRPDGALQPLRPEQFALAEALWAEDGRGAVVSVVAEQQDAFNGELSWMPASGGALAPLGQRGALLRWGPETPSPLADACGRYRPIAWEPPGSRQDRPEVFYAQQRLLALGYSQAGQPDGLYGDQTRAAVSAFQQASGLAASGEIDCATWGALLNGTR